MTSFRLCKKFQIGTHYENTNIKCIQNKISKKKWCFNVKSTLTTKNGFCFEI